MFPPQGRSGVLREENYFASSNPHPPHSRAYDCYNKFLRILQTSTPKFKSALLDMKQNQTGELLWRDTGEIHWRMLVSRSGSILAGYLAGSTRDTQRDTRRDAVASYSGILSGMLGRIHWCAALVEHSAGSTGEPLWRDTRRGPLASRSGGILGGIHWRAASRSGGILGGIHWRAASRSGGILGGIHWRAALAGYWAGSTGQLLWRDTRRDPLASCEPLWRDTRRDPLASRSGGILGEIHWRAALTGYSAGSTGELL